MCTLLSKVTLVNPADQNKTKDMELIVDTGSILTWVKTGRLAELGVQPKREKEFRPIEGRTVRRSTGPLAIRFEKNRS